MKRISLKLNIFLVVLIIFLFYFIFTLINAINLSEEIVYSLLLTLILFFQSIGEFFYFWIKKDEPRLQDWFRVVIFIEVILNFYSIINKKNNLYSLGNIILSLNKEVFVAIFNIFIIFFILDIMYLFFKKFYIKNHHSYFMTYQIKNVNLALLIYILSIMLKFYLLIKGIYGFGNIKLTGIFSLIYNLTNILNFLGLITVLYIIFFIKIKNQIYKKIFLIFFLLDIFLGILSGMKEFIFTPILYFLIIYLLSGNKIPFKFIVIIILFGIIFYPINNLYRNIISNPIYQKLNKIEKLEIAIDMVKKENFDLLLNKGISSYSNRISFFPIYLYAVQNEKNWNVYKYMNRYIYLSISFLPRKIIVNKPSAINGSILYQKIFQNGLTNVSITPLSIGWVYLEGGMFFSIVIFIILGIIIELVDRNNKKNIFNLILFVFLFHKLLKPEWDPYFLLASLLQIIIISIIYLKIINFKKVIYET